MIRGEVKGDQLQEYNTNAFKDFNEKALSECPNCHRTFLPRPLEIHLRSCKPKSAASTSAGSPDREKKPGARKYKPPRLKKKVVVDGGSGEQTITQRLRELHKNWESRNLKPSIALFIHDKEC